ncbi:MAG: tripartite tricarboxylate transporter substrate binding protein [Rhizobiales bacterium]|nr:tripartite tricarboxylate transporter substrate binding protein [Hyphomicrobiales bacterium]
MRRDHQGGRDQAAVACVTVRHLGSGRRIDEGSSSGRRLVRSAGVRRARPRLGTGLARGQADHHGGAVSAGTGARSGRPAGRRQAQRGARPDRCGRQPQRRQRHHRVERGRARGAGRWSNAVARAAPDGYTLLAATAGTHVTAVHLMKSLPYDPMKDFTPLMAAVEPATCLVVNSSLPVNSVQELIAYAKANPGKMSYGSSGVGSVFHMMGELFNQTAGVTIAHVPYRGVAPAMQDLIGGHIPMVFISVSNAMAGVRQGSVKMLAVLEPTRYAKLPQVPSMSEIIPAFRKPSSWFGFFGPAKMPPDIVARLGTEMRKAINEPDVRAKLEASDFAVIGDTPEQFAALLKDGIDRYGEIIKAAGIPPQ